MVDLIIVESILNVMNKILPTILVVVLSGCSSEVNYIETCADRKYFKSAIDYVTDKRIQYYEDVVGKLDQYCRSIVNQPDIRKLIANGKNPHAAVYTNFLNEKNRVFEQELQSKTRYDTESIFLPIIRENFFIINNNFTCSLDLTKKVGSTFKYFNLRDSSRTLFSDIKYEARLQIDDFLEAPVERKILYPNYEGYFKSCESEQVKSPKLFEIKYK